MKVTPLVYIDYTDASYQSIITPTSFGQKGEMDGEQLLLLLLPMWSGLGL